MQQIWPKIQWLVTLGFLVLIMLNLNSQDFWLAISRTNPSYLLLFCLLYPVSVWLSTKKWQALLQQYQINIQLGNLFQAYWMAAFYNSFLPTELGGDAYRAFDLGKRFGVSKRVLFGTSVVERLYGLLILIIVLILSIPIISTYITLDLNTILIGAAGLSLICILGLMSVCFQVDRIRHLLKRWLWPSIKPTVFIWASLYSVLFFIQSVLAYQLIFASLGTWIDWLPLIIFVPLIQLTVLIPITPNGLGIREGVGMWLFHQIGVDLEVTLAAMVLLRGLLLAVNGVGALLFSQRFTSS